MSKGQKITAVVSLIIVLALAAALGLFMWKEKRDERAAWDTLAKEEAQGDEEINAGANGVDEGSSLEHVDDGLSEEEPENYQEEQEMLEAGEPEPEEVSLFFTGDVMLGSSAVNKYNSGGIHGLLSEYLQMELNQADITMINQEFPFSSRGTPMPDKQYTFRTDKAYLSVFQEMGVDAVSLANNHALDYGPEALLDSFAALDEAGIPYAGAGDSKERAEEAIFLESGGRTVGILAASRVIPEVSWNIENQQPGLFCTYDSAALEAAIQRTREQCDYLVVYVHWGLEGREHPEEYQRTLGQAYIDAGADLVVGSHPHVPQGMEYYQGKPIVYSLGNFIFNPNMPRTYALKVLWDASGECRLKVIPIKTAESHTYELEGAEAEEMYDYLEGISYGITIDDEGMVIPQ